MARPVVERVARHGWRSVPCRAACPAGPETPFLGARGAYPAGGADRDQGLARGPRRVARLESFVDESAEGAADRRLDQIWHLELGPTS